MTHLTLRFNGERCDFLHLREHAFAHKVEGCPSVKDVIEALEVPHTEVDAIVASGASVTFAYRVRGGDAIEAYPRDIAPAGIELRHLQPPLPAEPRFILDVHLGRLAAYLRMLGFDAWYATEAEGAAPFSPRDQNDPVHPLHALQRNTRAYPEGDDPRPHSAEGARAL